MLEIFMGNNSDDDDSTNIALPKFDIVDITAIEYSLHREYTLWIFTQSEHHRLSEITKAPYDKNMDSGIVTSLLKGYVSF
ncbi:unnamed protein product [Lathyrus sativus]|nr:unnamed protein product [Lathyrus sativus]